MTASVTRRPWRNSTGNQGPAADTVKGDDVDRQEAYNEGLTDGKALGRIEAHATIDAYLAELVRDHPDVPPGLFDNLMSRLAEAKDDLPS